MLSSGLHGCPFPLQSVFNPVHTALAIGVGIKIRKLHRAHWDWGNTGIVALAHNGDGSICSLDCLGTVQLDSLKVAPFVCV